MKDGITTMIWQRKGRCAKFSCFLFSVLINVLPFYTEGAHSYQVKYSFKKKFRNKSVTAAPSISHTILLKLLTAAQADAKQQGHSLFSIGKVLEPTLTGPDPGVL